MTCNLTAYATKADAELEYIKRDAREAADAMRGVDAAAEAKYLDQVNDAATVLYHRQNPVAKRIQSLRAGPAVSIDQTRYVRSHAKSPKGTGQWNFETAAFTLCVTHNGTFTAARKAAVEWAKANFVGTLYVAP